MQSVDGSENTSQGPGIQGKVGREEGENRITSPSVRQARENLMENRGSNRTSKVMQNIAPLQHVDIRNDSARDLVCIAW
eukprot:3542791-Pyramimonas_sp.AAC.1